MDGMNTISKWKDVHWCIGAQLLSYHADDLKRLNKCWHSMNPVPFVCVCCVKCCWARSRWDQTTLDLLSEYIMTNRCAGLKHSSDTWCRTPSLHSSKALFFNCSWCDEWWRLKLWTLGSVLHLVWCLLWSTVGCPNLFDNPLFVHKHSGKLIKFWEVSVCFVCCWKIVSLKPKHSIIIIIAHLYVQSQRDLKWWLWV